MPRARSAMQEKKILQNDYFDIYFIYIQTYNVIRIYRAIDCFDIYRIKTYNVIYVYNITERTASVHTLYMSKFVIKFVFAVYYGMDCFVAYFTHV